MRTSSAVLSACVSLAALTLAPNPAPGQEPPRSVTLEEGLALFNRNSPEIQLARSQLQSQLGAGLQGRAVPNPILSFTNENLTHAQASFEADSARLTLEVKRAYLEAWAGADAVEALRRVDEVVARVLNVAVERFSAGDLAGYDLRRLRFERGSLGRRLAQAEVEVTRAEERLGALVLASGGTEKIRPRPLGGVAPGTPPDFDAAAAAVGGRSEVRAARAAVDARRAEAGMARRPFLDGTSLTGGLKQQSDGREGLFLGVQIPIPVLDRRDGAVDAAHSDLAGADAQVEWVKRAVAVEASVAMARLSSAHRQMELVGDGGREEAAELLRIVLLAYDEGEVGIVELMDATDTVLEALLMESAVRVDGWLAYFELDQAVGGLPARQDSGDER